MTVFAASCPNASPDQVPSHRIAPAFLEYRLVLFCGSCGEAHYGEEAITPPSANDGDAAATPGLGFDGHVGEDSGTTAPKLDGSTGVRSVPDTAVIVGWAVAEAFPGLVRTLRLLADDLNRIGIR